MATPLRLIPLLTQFDFARKRLADRIAGDPEDPFIEAVWWVNQELLHHGAEVALLRDLYRAQHG